LVHPVFAAKALMTVDHVSRGRAGLNIVCGWNQEEFDMFGHRQSEHDDRYKQGFEWLSILLRIFTADVPFDHEGEFYKLKQVIGAPAPVQQPRPVTLSAAFSPAGRRFAAATSDFLFTSLRSFESAKPQVAEIRRQATEAGRDVGLLTTTHVVCRETDAEARQYYDYYASEMADTAAVDIHQRKKEAHYGVVEPDAVQLERQRYAGGSGSYPLVGSPQTIAEKIIEIQELGFAGATLSFVNFNEELPYFVNRVLPLLRQAGLREDDAKRGDTRSSVISRRPAAAEPRRMP
jgi:dimethylsulfone monooxygenase